MLYKFRFRTRDFKSCDVVYQKVDQFATRLFGCREKASQPNEHEHWLLRMEPGHEAKLRNAMNYLKVVSRLNGEKRKRGESSQAYNLKACDPDQEEPEDGNFMYLCKGESRNVRPRFLQGAVTLGNDEIWRYQEMYWDYAESGRKDRKTPGGLNQFIVATYVPLAKEEAFKFDERQCKYVITRDTRRHMIAHVFTCFRKRIEPYDYEMISKKVRMVENVFYYEMDEDHQRVEEDNVLRYFDLHG